jgi:hypothetical protein
VLLPEAFRQHLAAELTLTDTLKRSGDQQGATSTTNSLA